MTIVKRLSICGILLFISTSCSTRRITIYCEPQSAAIYIDEQYQGNGIVSYNIPKGTKQISISCSDDGETFINRKLSTRNIPSTISLYINEHMRYSSEHKTMTTR